MQRLREQFSRRKQNTIDQTTGSEPVTPARNQYGSATSSSPNYGQPISDPCPTSHISLFRFPSNSSQQQKSPKKSSTPKSRKQILRQQAHSLPQSPPIKSNKKHPPLAYHESQPESNFPSNYYQKDFRQSTTIQSQNPTTSSSNKNEIFKKSKPSISLQESGSFSSITNQKPQVQSLQQQIHYKRNLMTNQMQLRYQQQQLPRHQRVNQSFSSSVQHMIPSSPLLQLADSKYRSASFEEIRNVKESKMIYEEHSIEVEDTNLSLSESNSSSLHNLNLAQHQKNITSCCSSTGSINVNTCSVVGQPSTLLQQTRQSNTIRNPAIFTLASNKSPKSRSFDCQANVICHTLHQQQSLQDKLLTSKNNNYNINVGNLQTNTSVQHASSSNILTPSSVLNNIKDQQIGSTVRCNTPQPISNIQAISTASISSAASDSPSKKRGPFLEIPKWRMLIRRTTTSNQLTAQHKNADGSLILSQSSEFSPPNTAAFDKQQISNVFEKECVHCTLIGELTKLNRILSRGTSTHTSLSSLDSSHDSDSDFASQKKHQKLNSISKSTGYFDLSSSIKELNNLSDHINRLELDQSEKFSSQFAKCSSGSSSGKDASGGSSYLKLTGANGDSLEDDFFVSTENQQDESSTLLNHQQQQNEFNSSQTNLQTTISNQNETNICDLSKSVSFNEGNYCVDNYAEPTEHTSTSNSRNASLISLPMVTLSLPSSESDDQITSLASVGQQHQQASNTGQFYSPPISPPPTQKQQTLCCKNKLDINDLEQVNNSSCITVISLEVPVLANKSGRSASVDSSAYLKVPQRTDIGNRESPPARGGQRSKSVDIALPVGPDGPYIIVPSLSSKPQQFTQ